MTSKEEKLKKIEEELESLNFEQLSMMVRLDQLKRNLSCQSFIEERKIFLDQQIKDVESDIINIDTEQLALINNKAVLLFALKKKEPIAHPSVKKSPTVNAGKAPQSYERCSDCGHRAKTKQKQDVHNSTCNALKGVPKKNSIPIPVATFNSKIVEPCDKCGYVSKSTGGRTIHIRTCKGVKIVGPCTRCCVLHRTPKMQADHNRYCKSNYICSICDREFIFESDRDEHRQKCSKKIPKAPSEGAIMEEDIPVSEGTVITEEIWGLDISSSEKPFKKPISSSEYIALPPPMPVTEAGPAVPATDFKPKAVSPFRTISSFDSRFSL